MPEPSYIFLEAPDESPAAKHREDTLTCLEEMRGWPDVRLHILWDKQGRGRYPPGAGGTSRGHREGIQFLLDNGAGIHVNWDGAVWAATALGSRATFQLLLDHGAGIHGKMDGPIGVASQLGYKDVAQPLIDHGADTSPNCGELLRQAAQNGHGDVVQLLIDYGADINRQGPFPTPSAERDIAERDIPPGNRHEYLAAGPVGGVSSIATIFVGCAYVWHVYIVASEDHGRGEKSNGRLVVCCAYTYM